MGEERVMYKSITVLSILFSSILLGQCQDYSTQSQCASNTCYWNENCGYCNEAIFSENECPTDIFLNPDDWPGAGGSYADPEILVTCTDEYVNVVSNGIPNYQYNPMTPNGLDEQNWNFQFPRYPLYSQTPTYLTTNQSNNDCETNPLLGTIGVVINGAVFYGPTEGPFPDPYGDPVHNDIVDQCGGHTGLNEEYHDHTIIQDCVVLESDTNEPSPILGYALDGFPVYGSNGCLDLECSEVVEMKSSYVQISDPTDCAMDSYEYIQESTSEYLDECNGRFGPDGTYRYHVTSSYPYIIGCYHGTVTISGGGGPGGGGANIEGFGGIAELVEDITYGDLNQDEAIDIQDLVILVNFILETESVHSGDINHDCELDILDIVQLVSIILSDSLDRGIIAIDTDIYFGSGEVNYTSNGDIAGIQLNVSGNFIITSNNLANGWRIDYSQNKILIYSLDGSRLVNNTLFNYDGDLSIQSSIISDWHGTIINVNLLTDENSLDLDPVDTIYPKDFSVNPAFPNPFNPVTNISFSLPENKMVHLVVFDLYGREIETLINSQLLAGIHNSSWNAQNEASGVYFIKLTAGEYNNLQKVLLVK